ncbi:MAG: hypothetical protein BRC32_02185 [Actinobacteria bacterium QS_8_72_14]|nr:MAG: hypothetical protein BRC32_02185 [Actinobacteria bacterium QS_8_72_14]
MPHRRATHASDHRRPYGTAKQGAKFGYTGARGYHPLLATLAATGEVVHARMRDRQRRLGARGGQPGPRDRQAGARRRGARGADDPGGLGV